MQKLAVTAIAIVAGLIFFAWGVLPYLKPLGQIMPGTKAMVATTREILKETEGLQAGVGQVQTNLAKVKQQDELLARQQQLMQATVVELRRQEQLAGGAKVLLTSTLDKERTTADLTARAAAAAANSMANVNANAAELNQLASVTARVQDGSETIDGQMDSLLDEMDQSAENFKVVPRIKEAIRRALERSTHWWE